MRLNKVKYQASYLNRMNFFERKFTPVVYKAIRSQIKAFVTTMKGSGIEAAKRSLNDVTINPEVSNAILRLYKTVGLFFANDTYKRILEQVPQKGFGFNAEWSAEIVQYFRLYLLNKATVPISETTREQIRQILIIGEQNGWGVDQIARKLLESELTLMRARMIVRTESAKAAFAGREAAKNKSPYKLTSEWIAATDHRTRHSHRLVDGLVIEPGGKFSVPVYKRIGKIDIQIGVDLMDGPGDPKAHKENVINCRCTTAERVVFNENEEPVMKRQLAV